MNFGLTYTSAPTVTPVSVELLRQHLRLGTNDFEANLLNAYLFQATALWQGWTSQQLCPATLAMTFDSFTNEKFPQYGLAADWYGGGWLAEQGEYNSGHKIVRLPIYPVTSVVSIQYYNTSGSLTTMTGNTDYFVDTTRNPARIEVINFPSISNTVIPGVTITFQAGYASLPLELQTVILQIAAELYRSREGLTEFRLSKVPVGLAGMIDLYRLYWKGPFV